MDCTEGDASTLANKLPVAGFSRTCAKQGNLAVRVVRVKKAESDWCIKVVTGRSFGWSAGATARSGEVRIPNAEIRKKSETRRAWERGNGYNVARLHGYMGDPPSPDFGAMGQD